MFIKMKGLLLKDFYTLMKQMKIFVLIILVFSVVPIYSSMSGFAVVYAAMLPITALAYDERSKWDSLAVMMPYSAKNIVLSKYIIGYISIAAAGMLSAVSKIIFDLIKTNPFEVENLITIIILICIAAIMLSVNLPFMFKMGVEKGRIVFFIIIAATVFIGMTSGQKIIEIISSSKAEPVTIVITAVIATILINAASILISAQVYKRKNM